VPEVPLIGLFETAFYQWAPEAATRYAVPETWYESGHKAMGISRRQSQVHRRTLGRVTRTRRRGGARAATLCEWRDHTRSETESSSHIVSPGWEFVDHRNFERRRDWHEHGLSPQSGLPQNNRVGDLDRSPCPF